MRIWVSMLVCCLVLSACGPQTTPIVINKFPDSNPAAGHTVKKGETLYSIAWSAGLDFHEIAKWNNISDPYTIYPGQTIRLTPSGTSVGRSVGRSVGKGDQTPSSQKVTTASASTAKVPSTAAKQNTSKTKNPTSQSQAPQPIPKIPKENRIKRWSWPAKGKVIANYKPNAGIHGIRIAAKEGSAVNAAAPGVVVYVGEGLRGYGKLVLIKHNTTFLSAYAHNKSISVSEGQNIKRGQQIAKMGSSDASQTMLHFEIRQDGKSIDPMIYLN